MNRNIPVNIPRITKEDIDSVAQSLRDGWISGDGPVIENFERNFSRFCERDFGIAVCNGTVAIDLAFEALGIKENDEVIVPTFTIISCISYLLRKGAKPIFVDCDPNTWNMDVKSIERLVTDRTKAILVSHMYGLPVEMESIIQIAEKYNLFIVEDAAEAHGQKYKSKICGSFGHISTFSFYANKNLTTGEGGIVLTNDPELAKKIKNLRNLNFRENKRFVNDELGYNYRMSSMQAALGSSQLLRIKDVIKRRIEIAHFYNEALGSLPNLQLPISKTDYAENHYWVYGLKLTDKLGGEAASVQLSINDAGVGTRPFFQPLHLQPVLLEFGLSSQEPLPVSEDLGRSGFYIPNGLGMSDSDIEYVAEVVKKVILEKSK